MNEKNIKIICGLIASLSFFLVALGGFVRATGAGLSCPDWPLCYGMIVPDDLKNGIAQEVGHRYLAGLTSILTIAAFYFSFQQRFVFPKLFKAMVLAVSVLLVQVVLGGLTVLMKLNPFIVTSHLAMGTIFFQIFAAIAIEAKSEERSEDFHLEKIQRKNLPEQTTAIRWFLFLTFAVFLQILIGGFVGSSGASLVCTGLITCEAFNAVSQDSLLPIQALHMTHRIMAFIILSLLVGTFFYFTSKRLFKKNQRKLFKKILLLLLLQITLGFTNVLFQIPVIITVLHLAVAQLILLCLFHLFKTEKMLSFFEDNRSLEDDSQMSISVRNFRYSKKPTIY
ncbi:MAG: COX15/CtaA family protein [Proteobacteria bacterium]|nr:COX15/CtaA family protein [Pseudomonadota bacterium]